MPKTKSAKQEFLFLHFLPMQCVIWPPSLPNVFYMKYGQLAEASLFCHKAYLCYQQQRLIFKDHL